MWGGKWLVKSVVGAYRRGDMFVSSSTILTIVSCGFVVMWVWDYGPKTGFGLLGEHMSTSAEEREQRNSGNGGQNSNRTAITSRVMTAQGPIGVTRRW